jgi:hypothetical protein
VISACGRRRPQRYGGNAEFTPAKIARKWSLNVQIAHSAWFWGCMYSGIEFCVPLEGDCFLVCHAGLVVKNLEVHQETPCCQACHNGIVGCNSMVVTFGLECLLEDEIAIGVEGDHDVLVP